jgi:hypothetical protein
MDNDELDPLKWTYQNTASIFKLGPGILEASFIDRGRGKFVVSQSIDEGQTWVIVREYDLKDMKA